MHLVIRRGNEIIHSQFYEAPKREWVGLTDEEQVAIASTPNKSRHWVVCATEAKLRERNT
jgi:hypothetical protein